MSLLKTTYTATNTGAGTAMPVTGLYSASITFTGTGTMKLQRSLDGGTTWGDIQSVTAAVEVTGNNEVVGAQYRWNCSAHAGSGNIVGILLTHDSKLHGASTTESDPS